MVQNLRNSWIWLKSGQLDRDLSWSLIWADFSQISVSGANREPSPSGPQTSASDQPDSDRISSNPLFFLTMMSDGSIKSARHLNWTKIGHRTFLGLYSWSFWMEDASKLRSRQNLPKSSHLDSRSPESPAVAQFGTGNGAKCSENGKKRSISWHRCFSICISWTEDHTRSNWDVY